MLVVQDMTKKINTCLKWSFINAELVRYISYILWIIITQSSTILEQIAVMNKLHELKKIDIKVIVITKIKQLLFNLIKPNWWISNSSVKVLLFNLIKPNWWISNSSVKFYLCLQNKLTFRIGRISLCVYESFHLSKIPTARGRFLCFNDRFLLHMKITLTSLWKPLLPNDLIQNSENLTQLCHLKKGKYAPS